MEPLKTIPKLYQCKDRQVLRHMLVTQDTVKRTFTTYISLICLKNENEIIA